MHIHFGLCVTVPLEEEAQRMQPFNWDISGVTAGFQCVSVVITGLTAQQWSGFESWMLNVSYHFVDTLTQIVLQYHEYTEFWILCIWQLLNDMLWSVSSAEPENPLTCKTWIPFSCLYPSCDITGRFSARYSTSNHKCNHQIESEPSLC